MCFSLVSIFPRRLEGEKTFTQYSHLISSSEARVVYIVYDVESILGRKLSHIEH